MLVIVSELLSEGLGLYGSGRLPILFLERIRNSQQK